MFSVIQNTQSGVAIRHSSSLMLQLAPGTIQAARGARVPVPGRDAVTARQRRRVGGRKSRHGPSGGHPAAGDGRGGSGGDVAGGAGPDGAGAGENDHPGRRLSPCAPRSRACASSGSTRSCRKNTTSSCGSASVATLLTYHYDHPIDEQTVFTGMWQAGDQERIQTDGFSMLDMKQYLAGLGYQAEGLSGRPGQARGGRRAGDRADRPPGLHAFRSGQGRDRGPRAGRRPGDRRQRLSARGVRGRCGTASSSS